MKSNHHINEFNSRFVAESWIGGCEEWIIRGRNAGWTAYYLNFMFRSLRGTTEGIVRQMHRALHKEFYSRFCTRFHRDPNSRAGHDWIPRLMLFPDRPVWKHENKTSLREVTINDGGLHFHGPMLIPPFSRFKGCVVEHIQKNQSRYARGLIDRIHIQPMDENADTVADYSGKTIKWHRADPEDVLILPKSWSEVAPERRSLTPEERAIKDIQASTNLSEENARQIYRNAHAA